MFCKHFKFSPGPWLKDVSVPLCSTHSQPRHSCSHFELLGHLPVWVWSQTEVDPLVCVVIRKLWGYPWQCKSHHQLLGTTLHYSWIDMIIFNSFLIFMESTSVALILVPFIHQGKSCLCLGPKTIIIWIRIYINGWKWRIWKNKCKYIHKL